MTLFTANLIQAGAAPTRRECLRLGLAGLLSTGSLAAVAPKLNRRAKAVLIVFAGGGQSQIDTWDPKPNAPEEVRGTFSSIATSVPGVRICEHLPRVAKLADKYVIVRSVSHDDLDHGSACYLSLTGQFHPRKSSNPAPRPTDFPTLGGILQRVRPVSTLPQASFQVNGPLLVPELISPGRSGGFLGRAYDPIDTGDPGHAGEFLETLTIGSATTREQIAGRRDLLSQLGRLKTAETRSLDSSAINAYQLLENSRIREAFDLGKEPDKIHEAYGRYRAGQACLLGRRLVEAGVPWVTVFFNQSIRGQDKQPGETEHYGWDTHNDIFDALKTHLLPRFDQTFSALLMDLDQRGLLDETLVVGMGEFGRAPRVALEANFAGTTPGRKHWGACYSVVFAGCGIRGGVYGSSDRQGGYPQADPTSPADLAATFFDALGVDPAGHYTDLENRPYRITAGQPLTKLFR